MSKVKITLLTYFDLRFRSRRRDTESVIMCISLAWLVKRSSCARNSTKPPMSHGVRGQHINCAAISARWRYLFASVLYDSSRWWPHCFRTTQLTRRRDSELICYFWQHPIWRIGANRLFQTCQIRYLFHRLDPLRFSCCRKPLFGRSRAYILPFPAFLPILSFLLHHAPSWRRDFTAWRIFEERRDMWQIFIR